MDAAAPELRSPATAAPLKRWDVRAEAPAPPIAIAVSVDDRRRIAGWTEAERPHFGEDRRRRGGELLANGVLDRFPQELGGLRPTEGLKDLLLSSRILFSG